MQVWTAGVFRLPMRGAERGQGAAWVQQSEPRHDKAASLRPNGSLFRQQVKLTLKWVIFMVKSNGRNLELREGTYAPRRQEWEEEGTAG